MSAAGYTVVTGGAVALSAGVAKSILGAKAHASSGLQLIMFEVSFDGVVASAVPVLVEICYATFATNSPGTNSTSVTPLQKYGRVLAAGFTAAKTWTVEPTALSVLDEGLLTPNGGKFVYQEPLGKEADCALAEGFVIRCTAPAAVNVRSKMIVERI